LFAKRVKNMQKNLFVRKIERRRGRKMRGTLDFLRIKRYNLR
jgi:hypothetical protein